MTQDKNIDPAITTVTDTEPATEKPATSPATSRKPARSPSSRQSNVKRVHQESVKAIETVSQQPVALQVAEAPHGTSEDSSTAELPASFPYRTRMRRAEYEKIKMELQIELLKVQNWVKETGQKIVILFEGRDAAGKGGTIKRYMEHLNPRGARVVAWKNRPNANAANGISSAISNICRPPAKSCSSTAPGITALAWNG
jgi:hypothetical protein